MQATNLGKRRLNQDGYPIQNKVTPCAIDALRYLDLELLEKQQNALMDHVNTLELRGNSTEYELFFGLENFISEILAHVKA